MVLGNPLTQSPSMQPPRSASVGVRIYVYSAHMRICNYMCTIMVGTCECAGCASVGLCCAFPTEHAMRGGDDTVGHGMLLEMPDDVHCGL